MTDEQNLLWEKINSFEIDDPESAYTFTDRLARENGWSMEYALRVVVEYKKFIFLICAAETALTPSDAVDQAWHLHLIYTRSYWTDFCKNTLGRDIHHGPTRGGRAEQQKYTNLYEHTLETYRHFFGYEPPADIWPEGRQRFVDTDFVRVNKRTNWILKKPKPLQK